MIGSGGCGLSCVSRSSCLGANDPSNGSSPADRTCPTVRNGPCPETFSNWRHGAVLQPSASAVHSPGEHFVEFRRESRRSLSPVTCSARMSSTQPPTRALHAYVLVAGAIKTGSGARSVIRRGQNNKPISFLVHSRQPSDRLGVARGSGRLTVDQDIVGRYAVGLRNFGQFNCVVPRRGNYHLWRPTLTIQVGGFNTSLVTPAQYNDVVGFFERINADQGVSKPVAGGSEYEDQAEQGGQVDHPLNKRSDASQN